MGYRHFLIAWGRVHTAKKAASMSNIDYHAHQPNLSKFIPPSPSEGFVAHERLFERLNRAALQKYVLIHAPEGYGKTSLLSDWYCRVLCRDEVKRAVWFRVDEDDVEPRAFWVNIIQALEACWPGIQDAVAPNLDDFERLPIHELMIAVANHIIQSSKRETHYLLILDNFESFKLSASEEQFFEFADILPSNLHMVIATRISFNNRLINQDYYGQLSFIGQNELSLTEAELAAYLEDRIGGPVAKECTALLYAKTEGWPLAAYVLLQDWQASGDIEQSIAELSGTHHFLGTFIFSRILKDLPSLIASFLLETAFLKSFCASLCNNVVERQDSSDIIEYLENYGIFTHPLDAERVWYRHHPLFSEWLQNQSLKFRRDQLRSLNHRAGQWYREKDLYLPSTRHIIAATEGDLVNRLTQTAFKSHLPASEKYLLWIFSLPEEALERDAHFCLLAAWAYAFSGRPDDARFWSNKALLCIREKDGSVKFPERQGRSAATLIREMPTARHDTMSSRLEFVVRIIEAKCHTLSGDNEKGIVLSEELLREMDSGSDESLRMVLLQNLGEASEQQGDIESAMKYYTKAMTIARINHFEFLTGFTRYQVICLLYRQGRFSSAEKLCRLALSECPRDFTVYGALYAVLGQVKLEQNKLDELDICIKRAFHRVSTDRNLDIYLDACVACSRYLIACHEYSEAQLQLAVAIKAIRASIDIPPRGVVFFAFVLQARLHVLLQDIESAEEVLNEYQMFEFPQTALGSLCLRIIQARIAVEKQQDTQHITRELEIAVEQAMEMGFDLALVEIHLLQAVLQFRLGQNSASLKSLRQALEIARQEQMIRPFINEGEVIRLLLVEALGSGHMGFEIERFVRRVIQAFEDERLREQSTSPLATETPVFMMGQRPDPARVMNRWNLTSREQEIVWLLQKGMNRKDIAIESCTSQNTVKTHISHIYEKVGVHSVSELLRVLMENDIF
jgi:LuxR family maltose regulon positive regulatory protein